MYLSDNPVASPADTLVIFQVCIVVTTVFDICALNVQQKLALLQQGINTIPKLQLLGTEQDDLFHMLKPSTSLPLNCGSCEFTIDAVTNLTALVRTANSSVRHPIQMYLGRLTLTNMLIVLQRVMKRPVWKTMISQVHESSIFMILLNMKHLILSCGVRKVWLVFPFIMLSRNPCHLDTCLLMTRSNFFTKPDMWEWNGEKTKSGCANHSKLYPAH
jgi:hypothetical protein